MGTVDPLVGCLGEVQTTLCALEAPKWRGAAVRTIVLSVTVDCLDCLQLLIPSILIPEILPLESLMNTLMCSYENLSRSCSLSGFKFRFHHFSWAVGPSISFFTSLSLSFIICKTGILRMGLLMPSSQGLSQDQSWCCM